MQLSQQEKILSERRNLHEYLEKEAERAFQGYFAAQKRLSDAQAEIDRKKNGTEEMLILLFLRLADNLNPREWSSDRRTTRLIRLKGKRVGYLENWIREIKFSKKIPQKIGKTLRNCDEFVVEN